MYFPTMLTVGKVENGFIIECSVPLKKEESKSNKGDYPVECCGHTREKQFIAKDEAEAAVYIQRILPLLDAEYTKESEFTTAFAKACGSDKEDDD